jgi:transposase
MAYITGEGRRQNILFPEQLDDYIREDNPVRIFDAFVDSLDMECLGVVRAVAAAEGRPGYDPRDMLKLYVYGYFNNLRSSRRLQRESGRNVELMWLINKLRPDFRTIADFRKDNKHALKAVFREFNRVCDQMGLYSKEYIAIDGSKFKGVNAKDRNFTRSKLDDRLERLEGQIEEYLRLLEKTDKEEGDERQFSREEIAEKVKSLKERKERYEGYEQTLEQTGEKQLSLTDSEARLMKFHEGYGVGYNVQTAVDAGSHLIADFVVTDHGTDHGLLESVAGGVKEAFGLERIEAVADKGYQDREDLMRCLEEGIIPHVFPAEGEDGFELETAYEGGEIGEEERRSGRPEDIKRCIRAGVIPVVYTGVIPEIEVVEKQEYVKAEGDTVASPGVPENEWAGEEEDTGVAGEAGGSERAQEEVREEGPTGEASGTAGFPAEEDLRSLAAEGYFMRDLERNLVYCPGGKILRAKSERKDGTVRYGNKLACKGCTRKCTASKYKEVDFAPGDTCIACKAWGQSGAEKQRKNRNGRRVSRKTKVVRLYFTVDRKKLEQRKCLSEHPFGTVKRALDSSYLLLKGKVKATAELSLTFTAYNMKRAISMLGARKLLAML